MTRLLKLFTAIMVIFAGHTDGASRPPKKILLLFDGTTNNSLQPPGQPDPKNPGQIKDNTYTHIMRLHLFAGGNVNGGTDDAENKSQISLYEPGIGGKTKSTVLMAVRAIAGRLSRQTTPMKKRLEEIYQPGDKLYVVGYSRGAASARRFAVILNNKGLKLKDGTIVKQPPIECLGCFETVAMQLFMRPLQLVKTRLFKKISMSKSIGEKGVIAPNVKMGIHNVALDDNRMWRGTPFTFNPLLMGSQDNVVETWFAGEHGDVGGSYLSSGMPDHSLKYMMDWMQGGLGVGNNLKFIQAKDIKPENLVVDGHDFNTNPADLAVKADATGNIHLLAKMQIKNPSHRPIYVVKNDKELKGATVKIHESVLLHMEAMKKDGKKYPINPNIKDTKFVVVGPLGGELKVETAKLASNLENDY